MTDNFIQIKDRNTLKFKIKVDGKPTGEELEFDFEDAGLLLKLQELSEKDRKNKLNFQNQLALIHKRQDVKGKRLLSKNTEDELRALNDFLQREKDIYNIFLGERGVEKLLNGRPLTVETFKDIDEIIETQIVPHIDIKLESITNKIKQKYGKIKQEEIEVLE